MKIYFGLGYLEEEPLELAKNWQEVKNSKLIGPTPQQYQVIKLLEKNNRFWKEIAKSRRRLKIPEKGLSWSFIKDFKSLRSQNSDEVEKFIQQRDIGDFIKTKRDEEKRILNLFQLHPFIEEVLDDIVQSNYIFPYPMDPIGWGSSEYDEDNDEMVEDIAQIKNPQNIVISIQEKITKNQLIRYINDEWSEIDKLNQKLPNPDTYSLSQKDRIIFKLRRQGKTYSAIADELTEKSPNPGGIINEDSVKTSYHRTKKKIESVAKPRKGNKKTP